MELTELQQTEAFERQLQQWDWQADLRADERSMVWLSRHTSRSVFSIYDYAYGRTPPPIAWLREAWKVLHLGQRKGTVRLPIDNPQTDLTLSAGTHQVLDDDGSPS